MNPNYNQTITIFNCLRAADNPNENRDVWYKTVLRDCFYKNVIGQVAMGNGLRMANSYTVRVPQSSRYKPYNEWVKLSDEARKHYFTFSLKDVVVKGVCADDITGASPNTNTELLNRYKPDAFLVTAFSDNTSHAQAKHYRLGG